ncbi:hypothetical protein LEN26_009124 [Aphanomyces euteiches]|nr:hypothetical protein LEN26_009124 [Aphanomyces euteiches]
MVDESNDISSSKNLVVMARHVVYGVVQVRLLGILALLNGTAESITLSILDLISRSDLGRVRLVGFASDGASVMIGCKSGVALRLSYKYPGLVSFHCPAHRVDLALQESMTDDDDHKLRAIQTLYSYFSRSHTRLTALEAALDEFNLSHLRPRQVALTRWLSLGESLSVLFETFFALRHVLRNDLNCPVAQDLYNDVFGRDEFSYWVAYMTDAVDVVNQLSKSLQSQSLNVVSVLPVVLAAIDQLEKTFTVCNVQKAPSSLSLRQCHADLGTLFAVHKSKEIRTMHNNCVSYVLRLSHSLKSRFPVESQSIIDSFSVLYPSQMVMCNSLASFGLESIETLASHYRGDLPDVKVVLLEYASYKFYALENFASVSPNDLLTTALANEHVTLSYPSIVMLLRIALTIPHGSVDCERAFSMQNLVKNKQRNHLSVVHLEDLMTCAHDGPELDDFDVVQRTKEWLESKKRSLDQFE